ncbi:MAG: hypothetical protein AAB426_11780 [Myxococcota bacterium]
MTVIQVLSRAWVFRGERRVLFERPGPWLLRWGGCRARLTPTLDEMGYPAVMVEERARGFHWVVRDMRAKTIAEGECIDADTAEARADAAALGLGR